jgi:dsRNA-specific ribonuclease
MAAAGLPPLPKIEGDVDLFLDVFTHNSLRMPSAPMNEEYGNTDRLAELGANVLRLAVATHFFRKKPLLQSKEINVRLSSLFMF